MLNIMELGNPFYPNWNKMDSNNKKIITTALAADINLLLYLSSCVAILKNINKTNKTIFISTFIVTLIPFVISTIYVIQNT